MITRPRRIRRNCWRPGHCLINKCEWQCYRRGEKNRKQLNRWRHEEFHEALIQLRLRNVAQREYIVSSPVLRRIIKYLKCVVSTRSARYSSRIASFHTHLHSTPLLILIVLSRLDRGIQSATEMLPWKRGRNTPNTPKHSNSFNCTRRFSICVLLTQLLLRLQIYQCVQTNAYKRILFCSLRRDRRLI